MHKNQPASKLRGRSPKRRAARPMRKTRRSGSPPPRLLHQVEELSLPDLAPGEVWQIAETASSSSSSELEDAAAFFAVLGCPLCGTPTLITLAQYFGVLPVMCRSQSCPALFRIADQNRLIYLPVN